MKLKNIEKSLDVSICHTQLPWRPIKHYETRHRFEGRETEISKIFEVLVKTRLNSRKRENGGGGAPLQISSRKKGRSATAMRIPSLPWCLQLPTCLQIEKAVCVVIPCDWCLLFWFDDFFACFFLLLRLMRRRTSNRQTKIYHLCVERDRHWPLIQRLNLPFVCGPSMVNICKSYFFCFSYLKWKMSL